MPETYSLILNSQTAINRSGNNQNAYSYYINWDAILPKQYESFNLIISFQSLSITQATE